MKKKILAVVLAAAMVLGLAACGGGSTSGGSAEGGSTEGGEAAASDVYVGLVTDVGGVNDGSFNQSAWAGLQKAQEDFGIKVNYLESKTDADYAPNIEAFMDEDADLIICVGYMLADATREAAQDNPEQLFAIIDDSSNADLPNVACLMFAQEQASYLVGLVAGSVTQSKTIGYVQGMVFPSMNKFGVGFISGVLAVCPDATVLQYNANNFGDSAGGSTAAKDMITKGADVIYHAAGGTGMGVIEACNEEGIWAIGVDTDQSILAPDHVITSAMKRVDVASQDISKAVADGTFVSGVHLYDLSNGGVDLAPTRDHIPADVLAVVEQAKADIIAGKIVVPTLAEEVPEFTLAG